MKNVNARVPLPATIRKSAWLATLAALLFLTGCKGPDIAIGLSKANIKTVAVDRHVQMAAGFRLGSSQNTASPLADSIVQAMYSKEVKAIEEAMERNNLHLPDMVHTQFVAKLKTRGDVQITSNRPDATFQLDIREHGLVEDPPIFGNDIPFLQVRARLVDTNGIVVWKRDMLQVKRPRKGMGGEMEDYAANDELLRADWETQVQAVVEKILSP